MFDISSPVRFSLCSISINNINIIINNNSSLAIVRWNEHHELNRIHNNCQCVNRREQYKHNWSHANKVDGSRIHGYNCLVATRLSQFGYINKRSIHKHE
ncbi:hypothetical protein EG68_07193 [Paragonimus skrjabini miyazakii]|uniref:Uncharacterized protein n=1 Tax=Paragonimus skrjabini miyazakii TaxID=59628 RepID=A0A8S9YL28_9TREM|nr:hypothetical protein EG68_07193 [Paragonimus skrjabini miyazakii]